MKEFRVQEALFEEIRKEMNANNTWGEIAYFSCYWDNIFTYKIENDGFLTELNIIADDSFFSEENPIELLRKKRIEYFNYSLYTLIGNKFEKIGSKCYRQSSNK